jgi:UDP-2-acetamido-2-deoxy-ribo-hexuluronate aminotransferase
MSVNQVPFITLNRFENGFREKFLGGVATLFDKTQFVGGPVIGELETQLSQFVKAKYSIGCANGTDAIQIALRAVGVEKNEKVLIPDMTFWATFEAVVNVGANPITVDVNRETCHKLQSLFIFMVGQVRIHWPLESLPKIQACY